MYYSFGQSYVKYYGKSKHRPGKNPDPKAFLTLDVGPGEPTGDRPVEAENVDIFFTNGPPYDWIYVDFPGPQAIQNLQQ